MKKASLLEQSRENLIKLEDECQRKKKILDRYEKMAKARDLIKQEKRRTHNMIVFAGNVAQMLRNDFGYKFFDGTENDDEEMKRAYKFLFEATHENKKIKDE